MPSNVEKLRAYFAVWENKRRTEEELVAVIDDLYHEDYKSAVDSSKAEFKKSLLDLHARKWWVEVQEIKDVEDGTLYHIHLCEPDKPPLVMRTLGIFKDGKMLKSETTTPEAYVWKEG
eukprot:Hpha_TRINITY_DN9932_c0_g1::TRINITY_DN9932_c0_g1_i1::g.140357::m.140357